MDTFSVLIAASGWVVTALWGLWLWHHKRRATREPEKIAAELRLLDAQTDKLRAEKEHLDAQIANLRSKQSRTPEEGVSADVMREQRDAAITALQAYRRMHEQGLGLAGLLQAYYAGRYAWAVYGMHSGMLESSTPDKVLESARETFAAGRDLATKYLPDSERLDDLRILAKRLRWDSPENAG